MTTTQKGTLSPHTGPLRMENGERFQCANLRLFLEYLTNGVTVFVLFLFVGVLHRRRRIGLTVV